MARERVTRRHGSGVIRRGLVGLGALAVVAAVVLVFLPLHHGGVSGNALRPAYTEFGWFASSPLPARATVSELRAAGAHISGPTDSSRHAVRQRRWTAGVVGGVGILLITGAFFVRRRHS
jgi:hypothetical protein